MSMMSNFVVLSFPYWVVRCTAGHLQGGSDRVAEALPVGGKLPEPFAAEEGAVAQSRSGRMGGVMVHQLLRRFHVPF